MGIFGWSYPPGAANDPNAPYNQTDQPCLVCGLFPDDCICPECSACGSTGDPACYVENDKWHGLERSTAQVESLAKQEAEWAAQSAREHEALEAMAKAEKEEEW